MTSKPGSGAESDQESIILASLDSYRQAEHVLASLGRGFRSDARKGATSAVIVRGNADGSLKLTQSRVLTASGFVHALFKASLSWIFGLMGMFSMLKGARGGIRAAWVHEAHTGSDEHPAHQLLADAGPNAALVLARCRNQQAKQTLTTAMAQSAFRSWDGSLTEFLAALDPGSSHDWVREALNKTSTTPRHRSTNQPPDK